MVDGALRPLVLFYYFFRKLYCHIFWVKMSKLGERSDENYQHSIAIYYVLDLPVILLQYV